MTIRVRFLVLIILALALGRSAYAQDGPAETPYARAGLALGPFLPSNFAGINEVLKGFGGFFGVRDAGGFGFEGAFFRSAEDGTVLNVGMGRLLADFSVPGMSDLTVITFVGIQLLYYKRPELQGNVYPYAQGGGIHMGCGFVMNLMPGVALRPQVMILNGPGRSALVEIGLEFAVL